MTAFKMPPVKDGFIQTLNQQGYMATAVDEFAQAWADSAKVLPGPLLEIGSAYGIATLRALEKGAHVIANDLDPRHLDILQRRYRDELGGKPGRLELLPGRFPEELSIQKETLGGILISRVLHFFDGPAVERAVMQLHEWLAPGGKLFIVNETPYLRSVPGLEEKFAEKRRKGDPWPGFVQRHEFLPEYQPALPDFLNFMDEEILIRVLKGARFHVEKCYTIARPDYPATVQLDGRESVGIIGRK